MPYRLTALVLRSGRSVAKFISLQNSVAVEELFLFRFGNSQLWTAHFGGFDQSLVLENDFDACDGFDDRFAEDQFF